MQSDAGEYKPSKYVQQLFADLNQKRNALLQQHQQQDKEIYFDRNKAIESYLSRTSEEDYSIDSQNEENQSDEETVIVETIRDFNLHYLELENKLRSEYTLEYRQKYAMLDNTIAKCVALLSNVEQTVEDLNNVKKEYNVISGKTNSLHQLSEQLMNDQSKLQSISNDIKKRLHPYTAINNISQTLTLPMLSVSSETFTDILKKIDDGIAYLETKHSYYETYTYMVKYRHCLSQAVYMMHSYVNNIFTKIVKQVKNSGTLWTVNKTENSNILPVVCTDSAVYLYYGKFQADAAKVKPVIEQIEVRAPNNSTYEQLLNECHTSYLTQRLELMSLAVSVPLQQLSETHRGDHCSLFRNSCVFMMQVCQDESKLFHQFFQRHSPHLNSYLEKLCTALYDTLRPFTIHINHIETLAELCGKLHAEMSVEATDSAKSAYQRIVWQLLQDVQERLVYRTNVYLKDDLLNYKPSAGDLAYPEKLEMMESISKSLMDQSGDSGPVDLRSANSVADLHEMWYPTVKRTVVCLSRLYCCVDRPIFQGLSQEALTVCVQTVVQAAQTISKNKTPMDGELFQIKHLLILRQQIAPFQVDFCIKEMSLDFSNVKNAAYGLIQNRNKLFSLGTNNALLEFFLEGAPQFKEQQIDSRKEVDKQLKKSCENFIRIATEILIGPLQSFVTQSKTTPPDHTVMKPVEIAGIIAEVQRNIKTRLFGVQRAMQLYLANRETESILFKPVENNVIGIFVELKQILASEKYTAEDLLVIACPSPDQMKILLSSASLVSKPEYQSPQPKADSE